MVLRGTFLSHPSNTLLSPGQRVFTAKLSGFDQLFDAGPSVFDALLRVVEALEHLFVAFCAQLVTARDSVQNCTEARSLVTNPHLLGMA